MAKYISYFRVSTQRQGQSGLGLEAQQTAVQAFLSTHTHELVGTFTEIESGRNSDRPQLTAALALARRQKATVVIAKLDRLARSVAFISAIMESGVEFIAADMPAANRLTIQIMAVIAENEAKMISDRTKAALAAAKARGVILGNRTSFIKAQQIGHEVIVKQADQRASDILPILKQIVASGVRSCHVVAQQLNQRGVKSARGGAWHGTTILNLIRRMGFESLGELAAAV
jgi:DNA invertase Pin-like site-specific DNA recombinase